MHILVYILGVMILLIGYIIYVRLDSRKKVAVMIGSDSDLNQCDAGLAYLFSQQRFEKVKVLGIYTNSIHRNMFRVYSNIIILWIKDVDVIIDGAGWAAHLPGMCEAFLRYVLRNKSIKIIPVAFDADPSKPDDKDVKRRNDAAISSISEVPKHQMGLFEGKNVCFGRIGFLEACKMSCETIFDPIILPKKVPPNKRSLTEALEILGE